jgi:hypothetical protein
MRNHSILALAIIALLVCTAAEAKYSGGTGEPNAPYQIATAEDLNDIGNHIEDFNKCFILVNDVNIAQYTGTQFKIIGRWIGWGDPNNKPFTGVFDGNDHKIWNFSWNSMDRDLIGLFVCVGNGGLIKNLGMETVNVNAGTGASVGGLVGWNDGIVSNCYSTGSVSGNNNVGGLVGLSQSGSISNCYSTGMISGNDHVGGLVGFNGYGSTVTNCYSTGDVSGYSGVGGLVGEDYGNISNCYSTGDVSGYRGVGGLVGENREGSINNCYSTGMISGNDYVGGLVGYNEESSISDCYSTGAVSGFSDSWFVGGLVGYNSRYFATITDCYSIGRVAGNQDVGGLVGHNSGTITNCYSMGSVSGYSGVGGLVGYNEEGSISSSYFLDTSGPNNGLGTPLTDAQMKQQSSFIGWDFTTIWAICEGTNYPRLLWSIPAADLVCPDGVNFADYSFFAERWMNTNCASNDNCDGTDFDFSGTVDIADLKIFCNYWLQGQ